MDFEFTLSTARRSAQQGKLEEWVHEYLLSEGGNKPLSDGLKLFDRYYIGPIEMPLVLFRRCCGPEEEMRYRVNAEVFERQVTALCDAIERGGDLPPLIVHYFLEEGRERFELSDGNHRHEAFLRLGIETYPVIVWITEASELELFQKRFSDLSFIKLKVETKK